MNAALALLAAIAGISSSAHHMPAAPRRDTRPAWRAPKTGKVRPWRDRDSQFYGMSGKQYRRHVKSERRKLREGR